MDRQYNSQKKKDKKTNNGLQKIHIKLKIEQHEPHNNMGVISSPQEWQAVPAPLVTPVLLLLLQIQ